MDLLLIIAGLVLLITAGDALVRGAVALSLQVGIPAAIVGATIVAFGTSAPELIISVQAALEGSPGIAVGNVVGSNIANVWLVLGVPALLAPISGASADGNRNLYFMLAATAVFTALAFPGTVWAWGGVILLSLTALMVADSVRAVQISRNGTAAAAAVASAEMAELEEVDPNMPGWKVAGLIVAALVGLPIGAQLLIDGARGLALALGVSEAVIGLTIVAVGTSLPELATTVMAALRQQADVAIGNVVGSNIFNVTFVIGAAALVAPIDVAEEILRRDIWFMIAAALTLVPYILLRRRLCRLTGIVYLTLYTLFVIIAVTS